MSTQIHMRHGNGEYNNSYAHVDAFVDNRDVVIHSKGSCDPHMRKDGEKMINDYNLDINKPKINGHTLMGDMTNESLGLKGNVNAYGEKHKVKDYLYEIYYNNLDYDYASDYFDKVKVKIPMGACSAVRKGDFYGRNFDWIYDESASFIVRVPRIGNRYASMGVSGTESKLTNVVVGSNDYNEAYKILPFKIVDGINEYGVVANSNVVPNDKGINVETIPVIEKRDRVCNLMLVRYILDNFQTAQAAVNYIRDYVAVYSVKALEDMHYELHIMVADINNTYVLEIVNNEVIIKDVTEKPYMTNFYLDGVTFNSDGKTYYPAINDAEHNAKITNGITDNGSGLERYAKIVDAYNDLNDLSSMINFMSQDLKYTKAYTGGDPEGIGEWYTEFVGNGITVASNPEDFTEVLAKSKNAFERRSRNPQSKYYGTWQTTHTSVYDMRNKKVNIIVQEDEEILEYTFNALNNTGGGSGTTDYPELTNKPRINGVELLGNKTSADLNIENPVWEAGTGPYSVQQKGTDSVALGDSSVAEGYMTHAGTVDIIEDWAEAKGAHSEGGNTTARGNYSHAEGNGTVTNNPYEHAEGAFNISHFDEAIYPLAGNTIHSIGIGSNLSNAKNAFEVMQNGDAYLIGIGDYDGTNPDEATTIQEVIANKQDVTLMVNLIDEDNLIIDSTSSEIYNALINGRAVNLVGMNLSLVEYHEDDDDLTVSSYYGIGGYNFRIHENQIIDMTEVEFEDLSNRESTLSSSNDKYPTSGAVKNYVDNLPINDKEIKSYYVTATLTGTNPFTAVFDKTFNEIVEAYNQGRSIYLVIPSINNTTFRLASYQTNTRFYWENVVYYGNKNYYLVVMFNTSNEVQIIMTELADKAYVDNAIGNVNTDYSTQEQDTGIKWIDGKTIYQRTINFVFNQLNGDHDIITKNAITDLDVIVEYQGIMISTDGRKICRPFPHAAYDTNAIRVYDNGTTIVYKNYDSWSTPYTVYLTIKYTKTTT